MPALGEKVVATITYTPVPLTQVSVPNTAPRLLEGGPKARANGDSLPMATGLECTFPQPIAPAPVGDCQPTSAT